MGDERERVLGVGAEGDIDNPGATAGEGGGDMRFGGKRRDQPESEQQADVQPSGQPNEVPPAGENDQAGGQR